MDLTLMRSDTHPWGGRRAGVYVAPIFWPPGLDSWLACRRPGHAIGAMAPMLPRG